MSHSLPVSGVNTAVSPLTASPSRAPEDRQKLRDVSNAVRSLNETGFAGAGREIAFSIDRVTRLSVVKVVDVNSKEVVVQWPAEYVLQLAANLEKNVADSR